MDRRTAPQLLKLITSTDTICEQPMDLSILRELKDSKVTADALYAAIKDAVESKLLASGDKMPSTRDMALYLGISRTTVMKAFENLIASGYLASSQGIGTWVTSVATDTKPLPQKADDAIYRWTDRYTNFARSLSIQSSEPIESAEFDEINFGSSPADLVPLKAWRKILLRAGESVSDSAFDANKEVFGYRPLREAIAGFLRRSKGIICDPEQIVLGSGVQSVISPALMLLVKPGDVAVCENPGFWGAREQFHSLGADVISVAVDEEGLVVDALAEIDRPVHWLYVAPSCQEPSGVALPEKRRQSLIRWIQRNGTAVLEDDWDSEFHYGGAAAPALFTLDKTGSVIYFYSFWRLLYPLISVGFLVIPHKLIGVFESYKNVWDRQFTLVEHHVLTELLNEGHVESHIRTMWKSYRKRRQALIFSMSKYLAPHIHIVSSSAGMHVVVRFDDSWSTDMITADATAAGLPCASTAAYYVHSAPKNEFMVRFSGIAANEIEQRVKDFAERLLIGISK